MRKPHPTLALRPSQSLLAKRTNRIASTQPCVSSLCITFITTFIIIYMTICAGLHSEPRGQQGLVLKGSGACWDWGLLREWHSGRRCPAGRASGGCSMVNRPFMVSQQSLLSQANSSRPAQRDGEGGGVPQRGFLGGGGVWYPPPPPLCQSRLCTAVWGGASAREPHTNRATTTTTTRTKTLAEFATFRTTLKSTDNQ